MIANLVRIQKKIAQLINQNAYSETASEALDELAEFVNKMSPFEIVSRPGDSTTVVRNKKTLKEIDRELDG